MKEKSLVRWLGVLVFTLATFGAGWHFQSAQAQIGPAAGERRGGIRGGGGGGGGGGYFPSGPFPGFPPGSNNSNAVMQHDGYIYVAHGNALSKFTAKDLKLVKRVNLSPAPVPGGMPGMAPPDGYSGVR